MNDMKARALLLGTCIVIGTFVAFGLRAGHDPSPEAMTMNPPKAPTAPSVPDAGAGLLVDLDNKLCPINGGEVDGETSVEWNHMRVNFCCPGCDTKFLRDPEGALDKAGIDWKDLRDAIARYEAAPAEHKEHQLQAIRARWSLIREP